MVQYEAYNSVNEMVLRTGWPPYVEHHPCTPVKITSNVTGYVYIWNPFCSGPAFNHCIMNLLLITNSYPIYVGCISTINFKVTCCSSANCGSHIYSAYSNSTTS